MATLPVYVHRTPEYKKNKIVQELLDLIAEVEGKSGEPPYPIDVNQFLDLPDDIDFNIYRKRDKDYVNKFLSPAGLIICAGWHRYGGKSLRYCITVDRLPQDTGCINPECDPMGGHYDSS